MSKRSLQEPVRRSSRDLVAAGAGLIALTYGVVRFGYGLQLPQLMNEFSLSSSVSGLIASGSFLAYCLAALVARSLVARRGGRVVLWLAAALGATGAVVVAASWSAVVLALGVLVAGSAAGAASPALVVAVASTVPRHSVARDQAVVNAGTGGGVAVAAVAAFLAPSAWRPVWVLAAVAVVLVAVLVDRRTRWPERSAAAGSGAHVPHHGGADRSARTALLRPVLAAALAGVGSAAVWTFGRDLLASTGGMSEKTTAALWVLLGVAAVLGAFSGDIVRVLGLRRAWALTALLSATGTAVLALAASQVLAAGMAAALFGGAYTALSGVLIAWGGELRPRLVGATTATLFISLTAGQAVGSIATGALAASLGPAGAFLVCAAFLAAAAAVLPRNPTWRPDRRSGSTPERAGGRGTSGRRGAAGVVGPVDGACRTPSGRTAA